MSTSTEWQLDRGAAERYLEVLEPAILGPAADALVVHMALNRGDRVVDVGCGTGAASLHASRVVGPSGPVLGVDINRGMIDVARSRPAPEGDFLEWLEGSALDLPVPSESFDVVLSAQTLQFVPERALAVSEMHRVLRPGGRAGASLWCSLERSPYFDALVASISDLIGAETAAGLRAAFALSDENDIRQLFEEAGLEEIEIETAQINVDLPPARDFVPRHIGATPMAKGYAAATSEARNEITRRMALVLEQFAVSGGSRVPFLQYFVTGVRPAA